MTTAITNCPPPDLPQRGDILASKYRIDGVLGVGGMAVVLDATHLALQERVAIKMLLPECADHPESVERFMQEGRAATRIRSEHVVRVLDVDAADGRPYLVLEHLDGLDLGRLVQAGGPLPIARAVDFVLQACEALGEAHAAGVIHRDLKPANLFLCHRADGSACIKVLDFGISKILPRGPRDSGLRSLGTMPQIVMGSPHYMSPEQMRSAQNVDARSDIWSLGAVLHELLAGEPPFLGDTVTALCARILSEPPRPLAEVRPDTPSALERVVLRCLEKDAALRYANVAEFARALSAFGSAAAEASAVRIGRVVEGKRGAVSGTAASSLRASGPLAGPALALVEDLPPTPMTRSRWAYAVIALVLGLAGFAGIRVADQLRAVRLAAQHAPAGLVSSAAPPAALLALPPPAPGPRAATSTARMSPAPARAPIPTPSAAVAPIAPAPPEQPVAERHSTLRSAAAPRHARRAEEDPALREPARPTEPAVPSSSLESLLPSGPSPAPSASSAPSNPDALFDERK